MSALGFLAAVAVGVLPLVVLVAILAKGANPPRQTFKRRSEWRRSADTHE